jgi:hypothetical protein
MKQISYLQANIRFSRNLLSHTKTESSMLQDAYTGLNSAHTNLFHDLKTNLFKTSFNIILPSTSMYSEVSDTMLHAFLTSHFRATCHVSLNLLDKYP